jgi:hypothetical protein
MGSTFECVARHDHLLLFLIRLHRFVTRVLLEQDTNVANGAQTSPEAGAATARRVCLLDLYSG